MFTNSIKDTVLVDEFPCLKHNVSTGCVILCDSAETATVVHVGNTCLSLGYHDKFQASDFERYLGVLQMCNEGVKYKNVPEAQKCTNTNKFKGSEK
jgi:hypothetical protein